MTDPVETLRKKSGDVFRELALHQGAAYRSYGEALARYGEGSLTTSDLLKEAGDLYYREAGRVASSLFSALTGALAGGLDAAGAKVSDNAETDDAKASPPPVPGTKKT